jgi:hypothetical protein
MRRIRAALALLALCATVLVPGVTMAHGGEAGIEVFPAQATAGAEVTVFGEDLEGDTAMELHLLTADGEVLVGEPTTDEVGHFSETVTLPTNLTERVYELRLTAPSGYSSSTYVTVIGSETGAAEAADTSSDLSSGLLTAAVLGLAGIGLLALALRPANRARRAP